MRRLAILDDYQRVALTSADWGSLAREVEVRTFHEPMSDADRAAAALADFAIVVAMRERTPFPAALLARLPALKLLITTGMHNASIDVAAAHARGIVVCGTGSHPGPTAELATLLMLALVRRLPEELAAFRSGRWQTVLGRSVNGATLGIVGLGRIGSQMAAIGRALGMRVTGWSRSLDDARAQALGVTRAATLPELLRQADVVTIHLKLNAQTRGIIGARELAAMQPGAVLVNTSRGPLVDEAALIEALRGGRLAGAAVDVYDREPLPAEHPFRKLPNVVATPHIGYVTAENYRVFYGDAVEDVRAWLAGRPLRVLEPEGA